MFVPQVEDLCYTDSTDGVTSQRTDNLWLAHGWGPAYLVWRRKEHFFWTPNLMTTWVRNATSSQKKQSALYNLQALTVPQSICAAERFGSFWEGQENPDRNPTQIYLANNTSVALHLDSGLGTWVQVYMALTDTGAEPRGCKHICGNTSSSVFSVAHQRTGRCAEAQITAQRATPERSATTTKTTEP